MKRLLLVLVVLVGLGLAGMYVAYHYLDVGVKMALEHFGPEVAGVDLKVGEVQISPTTGKGALRNLEIGNPKGFTSPRLARIGEIRVAIDPSTLTKDVVVIREVLVDGASITYERGGKGANLDVMQSQVEAYAKRMRAALATNEAPAEGASSIAGIHRKRFIVERIEITGTRATLTNPALKGQGIPFDIPDLRMDNVGKGEGGVPASEVAARVSGEMQKRIAVKLLTNVEALRRGGVEGAVDALKGLLK